MFTGIYFMRFKDAHKIHKLNLQQTLMYMYLQYICITNIDVQGSLP